MTKSHVFLLIILLAFLAGLGLLGVVTAQTPISQEELVQNGDMESDAAWVFPLTAYPGAYSTEQFMSPVRSARLGIVTDANRYAYSSMYQTIDVPAAPSGGSLILRWAAYLLSQPADSHDLQYMLIRDAQGTLHTIWSGHENRAPDWMGCSFDVAAYAGQQITLYFGVKNDGDNGLTAMYVDDVSLLLSSEPRTALQGCAPITVTPTPLPTPTATNSPTASPTPTSTPTPIPTATATATITASPTATATPLPTATATPSPTPTVIPTATPESCRQVVVNGDFAQGYAGWQQNLYLTARYRDAVDEEHVAAWLGGAEFIDQYLYQDITVPPGMAVTEARFLWAFVPPSQGAPTPDDRLTVRILGPDGVELQLLLTIDAGSAPNRWQRAVVPVASLLGPSLRLDSRAQTGAATTSWYLTGFSLQACPQTLFKTYLPLQMP